MAFLGDLDTLDAIKDALQAVSISMVPQQWQGINIRAHKWAENEVVSALSGRGYTPAQIAAFDRGADFVYDLTVFRALSMGRALQNLSATLINSFDRRAELQTVIYTAGGAYQDPLGTVGLPNCGDMSTVDDIFVLPPTATDDFPGPGGARGEPTEF